jgi:NTE family protein
MPRQTPKERLPFECIALLLQGGGALGAYQAGVYEALAEANIEPNWVAGISIGAVNAALIAGNAPEKRVEKLRAFWESITIPAMIDISPFVRGDVARGAINQAYSMIGLMNGVPNFYKPRLFPLLQPRGTVEATSFYDVSELRSTLERLVDFDRINQSDMRFSVGAVNVRSGNFVYFDNTTYTIGAEHILASGALPPGFPPVEIEGESYWDGGLVSNTPLDWVLGSRPQQDSLVFQVDLWSARGDIPGNVPEVLTRQKEIQYSSRTRASTDRFRHAQKMRYALANLLEKLPAEFSDLPDLQVLKPEAVRKVFNIIELIYRPRHYEGDSKDYEFSRQSMEERWKSGYYDTVRTLRHKQVLQRSPDESVQTFDLTMDGKG